MSQYDDTFTRRNGETPQPVLSVYPALLSRADLDNAEFIRAALRHSGFEAADVSAAISYALCRVSQQLADVTAFDLAEEPK